MCDGIMCSTKATPDPISASALLQTSHRTWLQASHRSWPALAHLERTDIFSLAADAGTQCIGDVAAVAGFAGGKFCLPLLIKRPATKAVRSGQVWESATHRYLAEHVLPGQGDAVTMGLFFGDYLPHLSRLVGEKQRVWGFEPNPDNFALARGTIALNQLGNCWIANVAVGNTSQGGLDFCVGKDGISLGGLSHVKSQGEQCDVRAIPLLSLDGSLPKNRRITVIHIDAEGQEKNILLGARDTIEAWKPLIVLEAPGKVDIEIMGWMTKWGYAHKDIDVDGNSAFESKTMVFLNSMSP